MIGINHNKIDVLLAVKCINALFLINYKSNVLNLCTALRTRAMILTVGLNDLLSGGKT